MCVCVCECGFVCVCVRWGGRHRRDLPSYFLSTAFFSTVTGIDVSEDSMAGTARGASTVRNPSGDKDEVTFSMLAEGGSLDESKEREREVTPRKCSSASTKTWGVEINRGTQAMIQGFRDGDFLRVDKMRSQTAQRHRFFNVCLRPLGGSRAPPSCEANQRSHE